jgi:hypothetical protein
MIYFSKNVVSEIILVILDCCDNFLFSISKTISFLFLAIVTILLPSPLASENAFADDGNHKKGENKKDKGDKNDKNPFKAIWITITKLAQIDALKLNSDSQGPSFMFV